MAQNIDREFDEASKDAQELDRKAEEAAQAQWSSPICVYPYILEGITLPHHSKVQGVDKYEFEEDGHYLKFAMEWHGEIIIEPTGNPSEDLWLAVAALREEAREAGFKVGRDMVVDVRKAQQNPPELENARNIEDL